MMRTAKCLLATVVLTEVMVIASVKAAPTSFTGSYTNNFDSSLGTSGTTVPAGFQTMTIAGGNGTYTASNPISAAAMASATASATQALTVWASGSAVASSGSSLFNCGSVGNNTDRALGSDPTGVGAMVIELSMTNNTGSNLAGVVFIYDCKCLTNGSGGNGTEGGELPGYSFFYSLTGSTSAADWTQVTALSIPNYIQGTVSNSGNVSIFFPTPLTNNGVMYFRWADDNCSTVSPDQMLAIDNIGITAITNPAAVQTLPQIKTVFVIGMENHNFTQPIPTNSPQQILGNPAAPYLNSLITPGNSNAAQVSYAAKYYNVGRGVHPSEPNYIWGEAGTDFGIYSDQVPSAASSNVFNAPHLTRQLNAAGIPWKNYQEDLQFGVSPTNDAVSTSATAINPYYGTGQYGYAARHNPMGFFTDTQTQNVYPLTNLFNDLANNVVGRYNWITPNLFNDMHTALSGGFTYQGASYTGDQACVAQGDNFLATVIPRIMASSAYQDHGVIIIRWDETENGDGTNYTIPEIIISPMAKGNAYASSLEMSHSSDVKTLDEIFGLPLLTNAIPANDVNASSSGYNNVATVNDLSDLFQSMPGIGVEQSGMLLFNGGNAPSFGTVNVGASVTNTFTITNSSTATFIVSNVFTLGTNAGDFTVGGIALPASVVGGGAATFNVTFAPPVCGLRPATLQIISSDPNHNPIILALTGTGNVAPLIVNQPASLTNDAGRNASFSVGATSCSQLFYQWYFGTNVLPAATNSVLTIASVGPTNAGSYHAVVTGSGGSASSATATLTVVYPTLNVVGGQMMSAAGGFQLTFFGPAGKGYHVLASDSLAVPQSAWTVVGSGTFGSTNMIFSDPGAANHSNRFYTVKSP